MTEPLPAHPDENPHWDRGDGRDEEGNDLQGERPFDAQGMIGSHVNLMMRRAIAFAAENAGTPAGSSMLDDSIWQMRIEGLDPREIAQRVGGTMTEEEVLRRLSVMYAKMDNVTATEMKALQVARLERLINMMYRWADSGSVDHAKLIIDAIERLNKIFALESDKAKIEIQIVSDRQASLIISVVGSIVEMLVADDRINLPAEAVRTLMGRALEQASTIIVEGQYQSIDPSQLTG